MKYFKHLLEYLVENTHNTNTHIQDQDPNQAPDKKEEPSIIDPNKKGDISELNDKLKQWNLKFSQSFKFQNDKPSTSDVNINNFTGQFKKLQSVIDDGYRIDVTDAINSIVDILTDKEYTIQKNIEIAGHTSSPGSPQYNQKLSERRSMIVKSAILDLLKTKNLTDQTFKKISDLLVMRGYGESDPIILNDDPVVQKDGKLPNIELAPNVAGGGGLSKETKELLQTDKEARQRVNRRVEISIEGTKNKSLPTDDKVVSKKKDIQKEKKSFDPSAITFYDDSYLLTEQTKKILKDLANGLETDGINIKNIYLSAHTESREKSSDNREKRMFILSLNRVYVAQKFLSGLIKRNDIIYHIYGCADKIKPNSGDFKGKMSEEKRVEILFDTPMTIAESTQQELMNKTGIKPSTNIISNDFLRNNILKSIESNLNDNNDVMYILDVCEKSSYENRKEWMKKIPREFWDQSVVTPGESDTKDFQKQVRRLINSRNMKDGSTKSERRVKPQVFFHDALLSKMPKDSSAYTELKN